MTVSDNYVAYVIDKLASVAPVKTRKMFNGLGVYRNQQLFAILANNNIYFKTDAKSQKRYESFGAKPFQPCGEDGIPSHYYQLPDLVLNDDKKLAQWMTRACNASTKKSVSWVG